jgi:hypothetical protein
VRFVVDVLELEQDFFFNSFLLLIISRSIHTRTSPSPLICAIVLTKQHTITSLGFTSGTRLNTEYGNEFCVRQYKYNSLKGSDRMDFYDIALIRSDSKNSVPNCSRTPSFVIITDLQKGNESNSIGMSERYG